MLYAKAIYAAITTFLGATITALIAVNPHTFGQIEDVTWLSIVLTTVTVTGGVFGITNKTP